MAYPGGGPGLYGAVHAGAVWEAYPTQLLLFPSHDLFQITMYHRGFCLLLVPFQFLSNFAFHFLSSSCSPPQAKAYIDAAKAAAEAAVKAIGGASASPSHLRATDANSSPLKVRRGPGPPEVSHLSVQPQRHGATVGLIDRGLGAAASAMAQGGAVSESAFSLPPTAAAMAAVASSGYTSRAISALSALMSEMQVRPCGSGVSMWVRDIAQVAVLMAVISGCSLKNPPAYWVVGSFGPELGTSMNKLWILLPPPLPGISTKEQT